MILERKTKIAYIIPSLDAGGAERFVLDLIHNLDKTKFVVSLVLFSHGGFFLEEAKQMGIEVVVLEKKRKLDILNFVKLYKTIKRIRPDIVHTELGGDIYGRLVAKMLGVKVIVSTEQNVDRNEKGMMKCLKKWTNSLGDMVVAISLAVKDDLRRRYESKENKMRVIYNGIRTEKFLVEEKRNDDLVEQIAKLATKKD